MQQPRFAIGEIIDHQRFGYRGVIADVDATFSLDDAWYEAVARSRPPKDKPWYHVLVHGSGQTTYVAERHLEHASDTSQIDHPELGRFFARFTGTRYVARDMH